MSYQSEWLDACFNPNENPSHPIRAYFTDGDSAIYTLAIFDLLKSDPTVDCITSEETGEILYSKEDI